MEKIHIQQAHAFEQQNKLIESLLSRENKTISNKNNHLEDSTFVPHKNGLNLNIHYNINF